MKKSIKLLLPVVAVTLTSLASATERVAIPADAPRVVVKYDAASLVSRSAIKDLHGRLFVAARIVCQQLESRLLGLREQHDQCVRDAVQRSVADVGNDNLTKYHRYGALPRQLAAN
jgi:UrcA family protein